MKEQAKRDIEQDKAMCERATPGPWYWMEDSWFGGYSGIFGPEVDGMPLDVLYPEHINEADDGAAWFSEDSCCEADRLFIAEAREALPHYIDRTEAAEKRIATLESERSYLLTRSMSASSYSSVGISSNAMVLHAFGGPEPALGTYPRDRWDLAACYRARNNAPTHLWRRMDTTLRKYEAEIVGRYPGAVKSALRLVGGLKGESPCES